MAVLQYFTDTLAIAASNTTGVNLGNGEFNRFSIVFPATNPLTASADITAQTSFDGTTWSEVAYSNSPVTATSTLVKWSCSRTSWGNNVIAEAPLFGRWFRLKFGTAATATGTFSIVAGKD